MEDRRTDTVEEQQRLADRLAGYITLYMTHTETTHSSKWEEGGAARTHIDRTREETGKQHRHLTIKIARFISFHLVPSALQSGFVLYNLP